MSSGATAVFSAKSALSDTQPIETFKQIMAAKLENI